MIRPDPVGLPGLAALALGFLMFLVAMLAARSRVSRGVGSGDASRSRRSIVWIVVQGCGIGIAGLGPIAVALDPLGGKAIGEAVAVLALMGGGVALFHAATRTMGRNWSLVARTREDHQLVQSGPFAVVRHPIYVALFLFLLAIAIAYGHGRNLIVAVPVYAIGAGLRVRHEERLLRAQFGVAYDAYAARVKRFVPGLF